MLLSFLKLHRIFFLLFLFLIVIYREHISNFEQVIKKDFNFVTFSEEDMNNYDFAIIILTFERIGSAAQQKYDIPSFSLSEKALNCSDSMKDRLTKFYHDTLPSNYLKGVFTFLFC